MSLKRSTMSQCGATSATAFSIDRTTRHSTRKGGAVPATAEPPLSMRQHRHLATTAPPVGEIRRSAHISCALPQGIVRPRACASDRFVVARHENPIREERDDDPRLRVDPKARAGESEVAKALGAELRA